MLLAAVASTAHANPRNLVPSGGVPGEPLKFHVRLDYAYEIDQSLIAREDAGSVTAVPQGPLPRDREFDFTQFRHVLTPKAELGIFRDTWLSLELPIIIGQQRELKLASGVDRAGLRTIEDGILPLDGFDARDPGVPPGGNLVFRGPSRGGLDQLHLGLGFAPMNQRRDDTKP